VVRVHRVSTDDAQVDCHITAVAPQVPGYVVNLFINDNTPVKEGDVLVQIDPRTYQAEVEQAKANLDFAEAQANSANIQIGLTRETTTHSTSGALAQKESDSADYASSQAQLELSATANLQVAEANVVAKQATNERAQADLARYTPLLATDDVSEFQFDAVEAAARVAKSDLAAAQQQLSAAQQAVVIARANAHSAQARVSRSQSQLLETKAREQQVPIAEATYKSAVAAAERARAALQQAELNLAYTRITAPISGQVRQPVLQRTASSQLNGCHLAVTGLEVHRSALRQIYDTVALFFCSHIGKVIRQMIKRPSSPHRQAAACIQAEEKNAWLTSYVDVRPTVQLAKM
jgi:membrane fusion protein, multidrug efflux system